jgi:pimeloyl-[acyl-carrier protein] methyl ester esterase
MHGWSGDSSAWQPWQRHFECHGWRWQSGERGYGASRPLRPRWQETMACTAARRVVIGHSLGPHLVGAEVLSSATDVVLLTSFGRFVPAGASGRALRTALMGMHKALGSDGERVMIERFLARAALPAPATALPPGPFQAGLTPDGRRRLDQDLQLLLHTSGLPEGFPRTARVLVVDASDDAIVAPEARLELLERLQDHLDSPPEHWTLPGAGHALLVPDLLVRVQQWLDQPPATGPATGPAT